MPTDWRSEARALALQCLTQLDVQGDGLLCEVPAFIAESEASSQTKTLASELAHGTWKCRQICDDWIAQTVKHWQLQRIALVDRAILRLAVAELLDRPDVPVKVILDQAIELAKKFSTAESPHFINGVLDAIVKGMPHRAVYLSEGRRDAKPEGEAPPDKEEVNP